jgi:Putative zinc-finger
MSRTPERSLEHREVSELIPWYVNARIGEGERQRVDAHLRVCAACRGELQLQQQVHAAMTADPGVEYIPAASLKRLNERLDALQAAPAAPQETAPLPTQRSIRWGQSMAASMLLMAAALSILGAGLWTHFQSRGRAADYYTVSSPVAHAPQEVIRAVFAPATTLTELQAMLDEAQLRIVSGPTEAGVYSLAANSRRSVSSSLALLRAHAGAVRFAEASGAAADPDAPR